MSPSRRAKIAGILDIVIGSLAVIVAGICLVGGIMTLNVPGGGTIFLLIAVIFAIMGIPPILGGVYALRRKKRQRAIICSLFTAPLWGIGLIPAFLISSAKDEFTGKN
jgi:hypothetical protein